MNMTKVKSLFKLFSGDICTAEHEPLIDLAVFEVERMISETADREDPRLDFLCAAIANYRYYQALTAQDRSEFTYSGKVIKDNGGKILSFAEGLLRGYYRLCSDIIKDSDLIFLVVV